MKQYNNSPMKTTAIAPANIAFVKYWGKRDEKLRLPLNSSLSMNLSNAHTTTTVAFSKTLKKDVINAINDSFSHDEQKRISTHLDRIRKLAGSTMHARVATKNNFPKSAGIASSASGFAALTVVAAHVLGLQLSKKELSILARQGSGSASRSIPDGFVLWEKGSKRNGSDSYAHSLYPATYWDIYDIVVVVQSTAKLTSSHGGMKQVRTSPKLQNRLSQIETTITRMKKALRDKNFAAFGELLEKDCLSMHAVMQSQKPSLEYWTSETHAIMDAVKNMRKDGLPVYFTIDAGPNVHVIVEEKHKSAVVTQLKKIKGIKMMLINKPAKGARVIDKHLF